MQPVTQIQVGAVVSGRVVAVHVDYNDPVHKGEVLADIDPTLFSQQIDSSTAQLNAAFAAVKHAEAAQDAARVRLERAKALVKNGVGSQADVDTAQGDFDVSVADVASSKAQVSQIDAQVKSNKTNLEYTHIVSPIDGVVITRAIDPGQTVAASFQAPVVFTHAENLQHMRIFADIDEADVGRVKNGMAADISVDAFPSESFHGNVLQVRYSPANNNGVVTYSAIIDVDNPALKLLPGMTATVTITSAEAKGVTRIPNSALRFHPSPQLDAKGNKVAEAPLPKLEPKTGRIYVETVTTPGKEVIEPRVIDIGISDGITTEVKGDISGLKIVRDETDAATKKKGLF